MVQYQWYRKRKWGGWRPVAGDTRTLLAEGAKHIEQGVDEPEALRGSPCATVTSAKAVERWQDRGNDQDDQDDREPQPTAQGRQVCVPVELQAVWLADVYVEPAYARVNKGDLLNYTGCFTSALT
jgi:hypothetical protein